MSDSYFAELTKKFTTLTLKEQVQQVKRWIDTKPHNEDIIPPGKYCRTADFVDNLKPNYLPILNLAYGDNLNQGEIASFLSRRSEKDLMDGFLKKDAAALTRSIWFGSLAAYHIPLEETSSMRGVVISMFARSLYVQWQNTPTNELLDETIEYFRKAVDYGPSDGPYRDVHFLDLGEQLRERYVKYHSQGDLDEASNCLEMSVKVNPAGAPIVALSLASLEEEKNETDGIEELLVLNRYIDTIAEAVRAVPKAFNPRDYRKSLSSVYWRLGLALTRRYNLTKAECDYQSATRAFQDAKEAPQHGEKDKLWVRIGLGRLMLAGYHQNGRIETAKEAERNLKDALELRHDSKDAMEPLGDLYRLQARHTGSKTTLIEATRLLEGCVKEGDSPPSYYLLSTAALAHADLYKRSGEEKDIERAIDLLFQATLGDSLPSGGKKSEGWCMLADCLISRFENVEDEEDLDIAFNVIEKAENEDLDGQTRSECYRIHGKMLHARYQVRNNVTDLSLAIEYYQKAVSTPDSGTSLYLAYNDLGNALLNHYRGTGKTQSLLESATSYDTALQSLGSGAWKGDKATENMLLQGQANTQYIQFEVSQRQSDIDLAIACYQRCFDNTAPDNIIRVSRAGNLAQALQKRFVLTNEFEDVSKSITVLEEVLNYGFLLSPRQVSNLHNLYGSGYLRCYVSNKLLSNLDEAAEHYRKSLASGCKIPSYVRTATLNLSMVYRFKASNTKKLQDMILAVKLFFQVIQIFSIEGEQDPQYEITLFNLAELVIAISDFVEMKPMQAVLDTLMKFIPSFAKFKTLPRDAIAQTYLKLALLRYKVTLQPAEALKLVQAATEEIPGSVLLRSLNRTEQLKVIRNLAMAPSMGIMFSLMADQSVLSALQLFEASRSVLWDNVLANNLDEEKSSILHAYPGLEARFEAVRQALTRQGNIDVAIDPSSNGVLRQAEQFGQAMSYSQVLDEIRSKPGLQDFLRLPRNSTSLQRYASDGPIIIVNGAPIRSDAIIICNEGVSSIHLPQFTESVYKEMRTKQAEALANMRNDREKSNRLLLDMLKDLWTAVAEPILAFLGFKGEQGACGTLPRMWWLTTGWIGNLPIHAAGDHKAVLETGAPLSVIDRVVSSYVGNIRALGYLRSRQTLGLEESLSQGHEKRALLVGMPTTPGKGSLPEAVREIGIVKTMSEKAGFRSKAPDKPKTPTVLRMIKGADLVHCACHGISSESDPLRSMLLLTDWESRPMSIGELLKTNDLNCQLVYLSACETAMNKLRPLEDEGLHLAGGFQMAGAVHVVASSWRVYDVVSVDVATAFYSGLAGPGGFDFTKSALSLRNAVSDMRAKGVDAVGWASYIHLGP